MKKQSLIILLVSLLAMMSTKMEEHPIELFKQYMVGDFDNSHQIAQEKRDGKQIHPYAKHINRRAEAKIKNLPDKVNGFYILEESYYKYEGQDTIVKPYLFFFEQLPNQKIRLHALQLPKDMPVKDIRNNNPALSFDYLTLQASPTFKPADYTQTERGFYVKAPNLFPGGSFTLEETIGKVQLEVMETLIRDGKQITPYNTPLIYDRLER